MKSGVFKVGLAVLLGARGISGFCVPSSAKPPKRLSELPRGSFETSINDTLAEDQGDFALCLRDVFHKFERVYQDFPTDSYKESQIPWKFEERERTLDICVAPSMKFRNFKAPVSVHMEMFETTYGCCVVSEAYVALDCDVTDLRVEKARKIFAPKSAWAELAGSDDVKKRLEGRPHVTRLWITYMDVAGGRHTGRSQMECFGY